MENSKINENIARCSDKKDNYIYPPIDILKNDINDHKNEVDISDCFCKMKNALQSIGLSAELKDVVVGPSMIIYQINLGDGVSINKVKNAKSDISMWLGARIVSIEPIPNKPLLGIYVERSNREIVEFGEIIESKEFQESGSKLTIALGKEMSGKKKIIDLEDSSNVLIAGTTSSGKSECIHSIINSILYKSKPNEVKFVLIDTKGAELLLYEGMPHLLLPVITDQLRAISVLLWLNQEIENRQALFISKGVRNYGSYIKLDNSENKTNKIPQLVIIIDDFADLIEFDKESFTNTLNVLIQRAEKLGIYIIIATEKINRNIINEHIKSNISIRIAFDVFSQEDSKIIIDEVDAKKLYGNGDMLYCSVGIQKPIRIQGSFISEKQINDIVMFLKGNT